MLVLGGPPPSPQPQGGGLHRGAWAQQATHPQQVVGGPNLVGCLYSSPGSADTTLCQVGHRFPPPEDFFHPFAQALAKPVAHISGIPVIQPECPSPQRSCQVRTNPSAPQSQDELAGVNLLVSPQHSGPPTCTFPCPRARARRCQ